MEQAACPHCLTANRLSGGDPVRAKCGRCGAKLFAGAPLDVDDAQFGAHLTRTKGALLVDVWAPWCGPCQTMAPHFAEAARQFEPRVRFLKLNADQSQSAAELGVRSIPTLILFADGRERARSAGAMSAAQLAAWLSQQLGS
jgi:thioredoxin 2